MNFKMQFKCWLLLESFLMTLFLRTDWARPSRCNSFETSHHPACRNIPTWTVSSRMELDSVHLCTSRIQQIVLDGIKSLIISCWVNTWMCCMNSNYLCFHIRWTSGNIGRILLKKLKTYSNYLVGISSEVTVWIS